MADRVTRRVRCEGGVGERYCVLCKEETGKPNETAHDMVTIRPKAGGKPRVAVCLAHVESLGGPSSQYEVVAEPTRRIRPGASVRPGNHVQGRREKGNIDRTLRRSERYGRTQRGRLGE